MPDEARLLAAFLVGLGAAFAATPAAIAVATRTDFWDHPGGGVEYKIHKTPTPYLGGAAVVVGFLIAGLTLSDELTRLWPLVACTIALFVLGTIDDRRNLSPYLRLSIEFALASLLWVGDLGWSVFEADILNLLITNIWVVGVANTFNLMDNMDGVTVVVAAVTALATAVLAILGGDPELAVLCLALSGACVGFLPYNASGPARIFLGDGGSLPIGFVIAAAIMALPESAGLGWAQLLLAPVVAGLPIADTVLRMIWRRRAGISLLRGGQDSINHILLRRLGSPRQVALTLGLLQGGIAAIAIGVAQQGQGSVISAWALWMGATAAGVLLLETRAWAGETAGRPVAATGRGTARATRGPARGLSLVEGAVLVFVTASFGLSPVLYGFYRLETWGPIALILLAILLALTIARPAALRPTALAALAGLTLLALWSLVSISWSESADQALLETSRWILYAALFATLVLLVRNDRLGTIMIGCATAAVSGFGLYLVVKMSVGDGAELFLQKRLHEPLGYINGQAGYLLLGLWPLIAVAERVRSPVLAGAGVAGATLLGGLIVLSQTRSMLPAFLISAGVLVAFLPRRRVRLWALIVACAGVGLAAGPLVDVYDAGGRTGALDAGRVQTAAVRLVLSALLAGGVWAALSWIAVRPRGAHAERRLSIASTATLVLCAIAALAALAVAAGNPVDRIEAEARAFKNLDASGSEAARFRFVSSGGNRYDYWRVAVNQFKADPWRGVGAGNYDRTYFLERQTSEDIRQPHSLPLQALSDLGIVGGLGLLTFVAAIVAGFSRRARAARTSATELGLAVAGGGMFLVWLVHTSVDWLHLIPGVTGVALCGAAVLVAPWKRSQASPGRRPVRLVVVGVCALAVLLGAVLVGRATLAEKYRSDAQGLVASDPEAALESAEDSLSLNDEALPAYYVKAAAHARLGSYELARAALGEAARREPHDFVTWALLGDLAARRGDYAQALSDYGRATALNPRGIAVKPLAASPQVAATQ